MSATCFRRQFLLGLGALATRLPMAAAAQNPAGPFYDIRRFGAAGDGARLDTKAIQAAIDACAQSGGGTVVVPSGAWLSGTLVLKTNVTLELEAGAVLRASRNLQDYPPHVPALRSFTGDLGYAPQAEYAVRLRQARNLFVHGCRADRPIDAWMRVEGAQSAGIRLAANDLSGARQAVVSSSDVPTEAVTVEGASRR